MNQYLCPFCRCCPHAEDCAVGRQMKERLARLAEKKG